MSEHDEELVGGVPLEGVFTDVAEAEAKPIDWVIEGLLPAGLNIWGAPPKAGKTTVSLACAALVAGYDCKVLPPSLSHVTETSPAFIFSGEHLAGELRHILEEGMGLQLRKDQSILVADDAWEWQLDNDAHVERLLAWLDKKRPRFAIIDPLRNFHSQDEKDSAAMMKLLLPLRRWAVENHSALVVVHHTSKPGEDTKSYDAHKLRGSGAIFGMADAILMFTPLGQQGRLDRTKILAIFKRAPGWEREVTLAVWGAGHAEEQLGEVEQLVLDALKRGALTAEELGQRINMRKGVGGYVEKLVRSGHIVKSGRKWMLAGGKP